MKNWNENHILIAVSNRFNAHRTSHDDIEIICICVCCYVITRKKQYKYDCNMYQVRILT